MNDTMLNKLTELIHAEVCGCDEKFCDAATEIYNWLANGDAQNLTEADVPDLVAEWNEYSGGDAWRNDD